MDSIHLRDDQYVLNHCTKYLARDTGTIVEPWRFPVVDSHNEDGDPNGRYRYNDVTFIYDGRRQAPANVGVIGTFAKIYKPIPLRPVRFLDEATGYFAVTVKIPKGELHYYKFQVDGQVVLDPINPQRTRIDNGMEWSRFMTHMLTQPINFERWEYDILARLTVHILPFQTRDGENFLKRYYFTLDKQRRTTELTHAYRLDNSIGVVNYIDGLLARDELHRLIDYRICLSILRDVLRQRQPGSIPSMIARTVYVELYEQMAKNDVPDWDYERYYSPRFFLQLLRRHTLTGAFSHPKYGGNNAAIGWAFLAERYIDDETGQTLFAWRRAIERPFGESVEYLG